ncbi:MAG TPA: HAD hydrolase family protein [Candidatus Saccharimonadales bacterium]|jgi:HAD superfamily hydrolase (TIGR01484 family)|nr:HAD hydrolase family protein [Candidatus Saccharimonadales bacterium]
MRETQPHRLAAFDYDGTITQPHGASVSGTVKRGIAALWHSGIMTTVLTARPYQRLVGVSGGIDTVVSPQVPLATERGARIVDAAKQSNYKYYPLSAYVLGVVAAMPKQTVDFVGFYPEELHGMSFIWTPDPGRNDAMTAQFGHDAHILPNDLTALQTALQQANPCLVTVRFTDETPGNKALLPQDLNTAWSHKTVSIVMAGVDKLSALEALNQATGSQFRTTIYAGNDTNDLPVLSHPELHERIFVGEQPIAGIAEPFTTVLTPDALGEYLVQLAKDRHDF